MLLQDNYIPLFEAYVFGEISQKDELILSSRIAKDPEFARQFRTYLMCVKGLIQEMEQDDIEFGNAMKKLSEQDLRRAIGTKRMRLSLERAERVNPTVPAAASPAPGATESHKKSPFRRERWAWISGIAATILLAVFVVAYVHIMGMYKVDNALVAYYDMEIPVFARSPRSASQRDMPRTTRPIQAISKSELKRMLPSFQKDYDAIPVQDVQDKQITGRSLVMVYLKLHDRKQAKLVLNQLLEYYGDDEPFASDCKKILKQIQ